MTSVADRPRQSQYVAISVDEANSIMRQLAQQFPLKTCKVPVDHSIIGHTLSEEIKSTEMMPAVPVSIKDGYAVISSDTAPIRQVVGVSSAGTLHTDLVQPGQCVRISTGGVIPKGADAVVMVEDTSVSKKQDGEEIEIEIRKTVKPGTDIRLPGTEINIGDVILQKGTQIGPAEFGTLSAFGFESVMVYVKQKVAVLSTGNELCDPSTPKVEAGMIRDSNGPQLVSLFKEHGFEAIDCLRVGDDPNALADKLKECFEKTNILVTSGGVSMGEKDYLKSVLTEKLGMKIEFGRVMMKPGLPCTVASGNGKVVIALPGNPASAWVCAHLYALPLLRETSGYQRIHAPRIKVKVGNDIRLGDRPEYCRARLDFDETSDYPIAHVTGNQLSARIGSLIGAQALLELPANKGKGEIKKNETVIALILAPKL